MVFAVPPPSVQIAPSVLYFGTPVALISTVDRAGRANLSPISSLWSLGNRLVLGMACEGKGWINLRAQGEAVINLPGPEQCEQVEALAPTTGRQPVPPYKIEMGYRFEPDKFKLGGFSPVPSIRVVPPRVAQCPLQIEARLLKAHRSTSVQGEDSTFMLIERSRCKRYKCTRIRT